MPLPYPTNPNLQAVPVYQPGRPIEEVARELGLPADDIIKLASNENPLGPSRLALAAMRKALAQVNLYPDGNAFYLKQKLAAKLGVTPAHLILGNGSNEIIEFVGHALISPGAEVVVSQYCFAVYPIVTALFGGKLVVVPAKQYGHDLDAMLAAITPNTRVVFVANPNNPTGTTASREDLARFVDAVPENVVLALDEAYIEFLDDAAGLAAGDPQRPEDQPAADADLLQDLRPGRLASRLRHRPPRPDCRAGEDPPALQHQCHRPGRRAGGAGRHCARGQDPQGNARGLKFYARAFRKLGLEFVPSSANFILVRVGDGERVFNEMQRLGVIVRPMGGYQLPEWIRISIGTPKENQRCLEALKTALAKPEAPALSS